MNSRQGNLDAIKDLAFGYGEFINTSNLDYGIVPLGLDEEKEIFWLKQAARLEDRESIAELKSRRL